MHQGMWGGMLTGVGLQTIILVTITLRTNWNKEVSTASLIVHSDTEISIS